MPGLRRVLLVWLATVSALSGAPALAQTSPSCHPTPDAIVTRIIDVDPAAGHRSVAEGVNNAGQVVGYYQAPSDYRNRAFVWSASTGLRTLGYGVAHGISDHGVVVGHLDTTFPVVKPFRWTSATGVVRLPTLGGASAVAQDVNANGDIVGYSQASSGVGLHAVMWKPDGRIVDLGQVGFDTVPTRIADSGIVAGYAQYNTAPTFRAFDWLKSAGFVFQGAGAAQGVNNWGVTVGRSVGGDVAHALVWPGRSGVLDLGAGDARAINILDTVVGSRHFNVGDEEDFVAALWAPGLRVRSLGTLGGCYSIALDINDRGQVVGLSQNTGGIEHATLWQVRLSKTTQVNSLIAFVNDAVSRGRIPPATGSLMIAELNGVLDALGRNDLDDAAAHVRALLALNSQLAAGGIFSTVQVNSVNDGIRSALQLP